MPGGGGLAGVSGISGGGRMPGVSRIIRRGRMPGESGLSEGGRNALRGRLDTSMPIAWIIGPAAHLFHAAMKLFEPLGF